MGEKGPGCWYVYIDQKVRAGRYKKGRHDREKVQTAYAINVSEGRQ